jgi:hypothetical protein
MSAYREAVGAALEATRIESPTTFTWWGVPSPSLPPEVTARMSPDVARSYLRDRLRDRLYESFYCSGRAVPSRSDRGLGGPPGPSAFTDSLSRANHGTGSSAAGWTVLRVEDDGRLVVRRGDLSLWVRPDEVQGGASEAGAAVSVRMPPELLRLSPGYYMALGNRDLDLDEPLVRHYWHLGPSGAEALVAAGTRLLNEADLSFRIKVLIDPNLYVRCDAGLLYTPKARGREVAALLPELHAAVASHLRPGTPALTKALGEGVAVAEDPGGEDSFGTDRCGILAEAMVRAFELGRESAPERLALVEEAFAQRGIALARPYLNAGSTDEYEPVP